MLSNIKLYLTIAAILLITVVLAITYSHIKDIGYQEATKECATRFEKYQADINLRIDAIQVNIANSTDRLISANTTLSQDIGVLTDKVRNQTNIVIKNGKCVVSDTYITDINAAIDRVNKDMGSKK